MKTDLLKILGLAAAFVAVLVDVVYYVTGPQRIVAVALLVFIGMLIVAKSLDFRRAMTQDGKARCVDEG